MADVPKIQIKILLKKSLCLQILKRSRTEMSRGFSSVASVTVAIKWRFNVGHVDVLTTSESTTMTTTMTTTEEENSYCLFSSFYDRVWFARNFGEKLFWAKKTWSISPVREKLWLNFLALICLGWRRCKTIMVIVIVLPRSKFFYAFSGLVVDQTNSVPGGFQEANQRLNSSIFCSKACSLS